MEGQWREKGYKWVVFEDQGRIGSNSETGGSSDSSLVKTESTGELPVGGDKGQTVSSASCQQSITAFEPSRWRSQPDKISEERSEQENLSAAHGSGFKPWKWVRSLRERAWRENRGEPR